MVDQPVIVSPNIQLSRSYDLVGIIQYEGSLNSGHYYPHKKTNFGFLEINDGLVCVANLNDKVNFSVHIFLLTTSGIF